MFIPYVKKQDRRSFIVDWNNFITTDVRTDYVVSNGTITLEEYSTIEREFKEKVLSMEYIKKCKTKEVSRLFKLMIMARAKG
jgi:hypothetical protein